MVKLNGSSTIEVITSSLIFMTVFVISLWTLSGLSLRGDNGYTILEAEAQLEARFEQYGNGTWPDNTYVDRFDWGEITTILSSYRDYDNIQQVSMYAVIERSSYNIEYVRLVARQYD